MNPAGVPALTPQAENRTWYRVVGSQYVTSAIATRHTGVVPSRFYDPAAVQTRFSSLYVSDNPLVAMFEVQALFGSPTTPGGIIPASAGRAWVVLTVQMRLSAVVDLTDITEQMRVDTKVQEHTGDWRGYAQRSPVTPVSLPVGTAPTQVLGDAIFRDPRDIEGLLTVSAKVPYHRNLVALPAHLRSSSFIQYDWSDAGGRHSYRIDQANFDGVQIR